MITNFNEYLNESKPFVLDLYTPDQLGEMVMDEYYSKGGDLNRVLHLIDAGANVNTQDQFGQTLLHHAIFHDHTEVVKALLKNGAILADPESRAQTPLHYAVARNRIECAKLLLAAGAPKNADNGLGQTPWDYASQEMKETLPELQP